ncbi:galectin-3b isoform X2 [Cynoglossus semilaevis]|uniref:Galectin n=1 Tax=Cynoglossus semilaevis TaxID=244447 RepID=A0A3P8VXK0_CYNSE|nr:galectin-5-like isoform X2 [Cynoglossus semilaevis]
MDLSDALEDWPSGGNQSTGSGMWSGNNPNPNPNPNPTWPGQPQPNPTWPGQPSAGGPTWPGGQPTQPSWPSPQPTSGGGWPSPAPGPTPAPPSAPQRSLSVPYYHQLQNGVHDKMLITIVGTVNPNPQKITVDLNAGHDFAFHFNPRFNEDGHKVIVRNSCIGDKWGKEEREISNFPFVPGQRFEMKILCTNTEYRVAVNNSHIVEYKHRLPNLRAINRLSIYNDVTLHDVQVTRLP